MLMGKAISGNKYPWFDWFTAGLLGVGTSIFLLSNSEGKNSLENYFCNNLWFLKIKAYKTLNSFIK